MEKNIISYSSDDAREERLKDALVAESVLRVHVWSDRGCSFCDPRGEDLVVSDDGTLMSVDERFNHPSEINLAKAWKLLDSAQERAQKEFDQAQRDLATCAEIRQRLEKVREFRSIPSRRPGPFAELLKLIQ